MTEANIGTVDPRRAPFAAWWMIGVLSLIYIFSIVDRNIITLMVSPIKRALDLTDSQMGLILGPAFSVVYAIFGIPLGWAADKFPRQWVIFLGTAFFGCACMASALAGSFLSLFLARAFVAIGEASLSPAAYSLISDKFPRNQVTTASAFFNTASRLGYAASYAIGGLAVGTLGAHEIGVPLLGPLPPWRVIFLMTGLPAIVFALLVFSFREGPRSTVNERNGTIATSAFVYLTANWRLMLPLLVGLTLDGICTSAMSSWVPTYLIRHFAMSAAHFGPILSTISLCSAFALVFKGALVDYLYGTGKKDIHVRFYTWLIAAFFPISCTMFFAADPTRFLLMYAAVQVFAMTLIVYIAATIQLIVPPILKGRIIGVFIFVLSVLGLGMGPLIVGSVTDLVFRDESKVGWSLAVVVCSVFPLIFLSLRFALKPLRVAMTATESSP